MGADFNTIGPAVTLFVLTHLIRLWNLVGQSVSTMKHYNMKYYNMNVLVCFTKKVDCGWREEDIHPGLENIDILAIPSQIIRS